MSIDTVSDLPPRVQYTAAAAQTVFPYTFPIFQDADLVVEIDGVVQTLTTDYAVSGEGDDTGGNVTLVVALAGGEIVTIYRDTVIERTSDFQQNGPFFSASVNDEFDRLFIIAQELKSKIGRAIRFPFNAQTTDAQQELNPISSWLGKFLRVSAAGVLEAAELVSSVVPLTQSLIGQLLNPITDAEIAAGVTPTNYWVPSHDSCGEVYPARYGTVDPTGAVNQATIFATAYRVAKEADCDLRLPSGTFRITANLLWDGVVSVRGSSRRGTILAKHISGGDFVGVTITSGGRGCEFCDFALTTTTGTGGTPPTPGTGHGIEMGEDTNVSLHDVDIFYQSGHGLYLNNTTSTGNFNQYKNVGTLYNGVDGVRVNNHSSARWDNINAYGNVGWGFNIPTTGSGHSFHTGTMIICQANTAGGANVASQNNVMQFYGEGNTGPDVNLTVDSYQNLITIYRTDSAPSDIADLGTRNTLLHVSAAAVGGVYSERFSRPPRTTNVVGLDSYLVGGQAGAGASPRQGGTAYVLGGPSAGTGNADGGAAVVSGGDPVGTGVPGVTQLQPYGGGVVACANSTPTNASVGIEIQSTTKAFVASRMTTTQRNALTATDGMYLYNTSTAKFQGRAGGVWVDWH